MMRSDAAGTSVAEPMPAGRRTCSSTASNQLPCTASRTARAPRTRGSSTRTAPGRHRRRGRQIQRHPDGRSEWVTEEAVTDRRRYPGQPGGVVDEVTDRHLAVGHAGQVRRDRPSELERDRSSRPDEPLRDAPPLEQRPFDVRSGRLANGLPTVRRPDARSPWPRGTLPFMYQHASVVTMPGAMVSALVIEIGGAILVMWLTWRAANGQLGRNDLAGIRTRVTMSSDEAWRTGHRAALPPALISGVITILCCAVCIVVPSLRTPASVIVVSVVLLGGALLSIPFAHRAVDRAELEDRTGLEDAQTDTPAAGRGR